MELTIHEVKAAVEGVNTTFNALKESLETKLAEKANRGEVDPLVEDKISRINEALGRYQEKMDAIAVQMSRPVLSGSDREDREAAETKSAFVKYLRRGEKGLSEKELGLLESKAFEEGNRASPTGYAILIPVPIQEAIMELRTTRNSLRQFARTVTVSAKKISIPIASGSFGVGWADELETPYVLDPAEPMYPDAGGPPWFGVPRGPTSTPTLTIKSYELFELFAEPHATRIILEDAGFDLEGFIKEGVGVAMANEEAVQFMSGSASNTPKGLLLAANLQTNTATALSHDKIRVFTAANAVGATAAGFDLVDLVNVQTDLDPGYAGAAAWYMSRLAQSYVRVMTLEDGSFVWQPSIVAGQPQTLLGDPVRTLTTMPTPAGTNAIVALYGDMAEGYMILDHTAPMVAIRDELTDKRYIKFYTRTRVGGGLRMGAALRALRLGTVA